MNQLVLSCIALFSAVSWAQAPSAPSSTVAKPTATEKAAVAHKASDKKTYAVINTSMGTIKLLLYTDKSPKTVENFVGLAEGTKEWTDPKSGKKVKKPFYNGLTFHRIIDGFMIQGGDPLGNGQGGPGYQFDNEHHPEALHNKPGILAMANAGPNTNGSQFYITVAPRPDLDGPYTVFGEVTEGMDVATKISKVKVDHANNDRPITPVVIKSVKIERK